MKIIPVVAIVLALSAINFPAWAQSPGPRASVEGGAGVSARLERLEEQLANLQGVVAAVETLAKNNAGGTTGYANAASGGASTEQVRQLSEQIAELTQRLERLEARLGASTAPVSGQPRQQANSGPALPSGFEDKEQLPPLSTPQAPLDRKPAAPSNSGPQTAVVGVPVTSRPSSQPSSGAARTLFDQGYGALNRREYSAAETYFQQFLDQYPTDPLAGTAQYWLGETAFVSGEYRSAADRFLKTFTNFPNSEKAPEALLKLAISLRRLGESSAACESFAELERRFPQAPKTILQRAETEKKRANCT